MGHKHADSDVAPVLPLVIMRDVDLPAKGQEPHAWLPVSVLYALTGHARQENSPCGSLPAGQPEKRTYARSSNLPMTTSVLPNGPCRLIISNCGAAGSLVPREIEVTV